MKTLLSIFILFLSPFFLLAQIEEPNNSFSNANTISTGTPYQAYIDEAQDLDYYRFHVPSPGIIKFELGHVPSNIDLRAFIYHPDQFTEIRKKVYISNGEEYIIEVSTCETGYHYLFLSDEGAAGGSQGSNFNATEAYTFKVDFTPFSELDIYECNNESFNTAAEIAFGQINRALIAPVFDDDPSDYDQDYYKFMVSEAGIIKLELSDVPSNIDLRAFIYHPDQFTEIRKQIYTSNGDEYTIEVSTCETGYHYLFISDEGVSGNQGSHYNSEDQYSFKVDFTPFSELDIYECNNESFNTAAEIAFGQVNQALITPVFDDDPSDYDQDYYKFMVSEAGIIKLELSNVPDNIDLRSFIYHPDQFTEIRHQDYNSNGDEYTIEVSTCETGFHYLFLSDEGPSGSQGAHYNSEDQYSFKVDFTAFSELDGCECENESFDNVCPISSCDTINAVVAPVFDDDPREKDFDFYTTYLEAGTELEINIALIENNIDLCLEIFNPNQESLDIVETNSNGVIQTSIIADITGDYFIVISNCDNSFNSSAPYTLNIGCDIINNTTEFDKDMNIKLYPNPISDRLSISSADLDGAEVLITITDIKGRQVFYKQTHIQSPLSINTADLPEGVLLLKLRSELGVYTTRLVKSH